MGTFKEFDKDLQHAVNNPDAEPLHLDGEQTLFGDTSVELSSWACFQRNHEANKRRCVCARRSTHPSAIRFATSAVMIPVLAAERGSRNAASESIRAP
jgi:hypothetical protein